MAALVGGATAGALVFGRGCALAAGIAASFAMIATGSGFLVVASGHAAVAAVAHIRRWRVGVVGVIWFVSSSTVSRIVAIWLPLAIVGVRHANGSGQLG